MGYISGQIEKIYKSVLFRRHDPDGSVFYFDYEDFDGLHSDEFSFTSKRGHKLYGSFYYYDGYAPDRLIVFEHGMGNGLNGYFREIEMLAKKGYLVYSYDHTGCFRSEGEHIHGLSGSLSDLDDCINVLTTERGFSEENISVVGHSWGGFSAMNVLAFHPNLHSIVALSGFISVKVMQKQIASFILAPFRKSLFALEKRTNSIYAEINAIDTLSATEKPVFIIHSMDDNTVSYRTNYEVLSHALFDKTNVEFLLVNGSGHSPQYTAPAFAYKESFFKDLKNQRRRNKLVTEEQKESFIDSYDWFAMTEQNEDLWDKILKFLEK